MGQAKKCSVLMVPSRCCTKVITDTVYLIHRITYLSVISWLQYLTFIVV